MTPKVVFHIDFDKEHRLQMGFVTIRNLLKQAPPGKQPSIYVVAEGASVGLFKKDRGALFAKDMKELDNLGVRFLVCEESAKRQGLSKEDFLEHARLINSGIWELIRLQHEGFAYVKP